MIEIRANPIELGPDQEFLAKIEQAKQQWFIPREQRVEIPVIDAEGKTVAVSIDTHSANAKIRADVRQHTIEGEGDHGEAIVWLVLDFDDVLNRTTEYQNFLKQKFFELGLAKEEFDRLYNESKVPGAEKSIFDYQLFISKIKSVLSGKGDNIDALLEDVDYKRFLDQAVIRAAEALKAKLPRLKITLLTFGDQRYQQMRIDQTDIDQVVDQIVYTEGSKREVIEALRREEFLPPPYPEGLRAYKPEDFAFTITVDDSPEQVQDYDKVHGMPKSINVRYRHPSAKRYQAESGLWRLLNLMRIQKTMRH